METLRNPEMRLTKWPGRILLALGTVSLMLGIAAKLLSEEVPWTAWALPALLLSGLLVTLYLPRAQFPRATKGYYFFALVSALCIIASSVVRLIQFVERAI